MKKHFRTIHVVVAILIMAFIFVQSALPADLSGRESNVIVQILVQLLSLEPDSISFGVRKAAHFTEYLLLGCILVPVMREHGRGGALAWSIGTVYAITDELHQSFVPERSCELRDMCIDSIGVFTGVLIGLLVFVLWDRRMKRKTE